nr:uncharacterized protein LOC106686857 isoform X1 [Halyomorpha halys]
MIPRDCTVSDLDRGILLQVNSGQKLWRRVKVTWVYFDSLTFIRHWLHHCSIRVRCVWRLNESVTGSGYDTCIIGICCQERVSIDGIVSGEEDVDDRYLSTGNHCEFERSDLRGVRIQDTPGLCCPARRGGCCADSLDCCQVIIDHKPALPVPGFC